MHQKLSFAILAFFVSCLLSPVSCPFARAEETLTITTYYPSPYGSYNQLRTYRDTHLATEGGSVGIGTTDPRAKLTINTPADYGGDTIRFASNAEPSVYYLNLNTAVTGGVVRWVFDQNNARTNYPNVLAFDRGNVGIGMAQPIARLAVAGNQMDILVGDAGCSAGYGGIGFGALSGCNNYSLLGNGASTLINRPQNGYLYFREANNDQMVITPGGNVGIGASGIFARLDVEGRVNVGSGTSQNRFASEEEQLQILTDAGTVGAIGLWQAGQAYAKLGNRANDPNFYITNSYSGSALGTADRSITLTRDGYVGIGQIPGERLDVNGKIHATDDVCVDLAGGGQKCLRGGGGGSVGTTDLRTSIGVITANLGGWSIGPEHGRRSHVLNDYSFFPNFFSNRGNCVIGGSSSIVDDTTARLDIRNLMEYEVCDYRIQWRYITSSRDQEIFAWYNTEKKAIESLWISEIEYPEILPVEFKSIPKGWVPIQATVFDKNLVRIGKRPNAKNIQENYTFTRYAKPQDIPYNDELMQIVKDRTQCLAENPDHQTACIQIITHPDIYFGKLEPKKISK